MTCYTSLKSIISLGLLCFGITFLSHAQIDTLEVSHPDQGITYISLADSSQPWRIHLLEIDLQNTSAEIHSQKAIADGDPQSPTRQTLSEMWTHLQSNGKKPIAGINADFFNLKTGDPINIQISDGQPAYVPHAEPKRSQFGITTDDTPFIDVLDFRGSVVIDQLQLTVDGINNMPPKDGLTFINRKPDQSIKGLDSLFAASLQLLPGQKSHYIFDDQNFLPPLLIASGAMKDSLRMLQNTADTLQTHFQFSNTQKSHRQIEELVGGSVQLLEDGEEVIDRQLKVEGVGQSFASDRHPRTAIGMSKNDHLYMIVVDGRQEQSIGMSLYELADFMTEYDISDGLNLDGGGSTSMIINEEIVNSPSDKSGARPVANALFIIK